jgi:8-oxo-dGTP diphosphatase
MKDRSAKSGTPIMAAGGVVVRGGREPLIAVVQLRKSGSWVLPKGKLNRDETAIAAARREVLEEVGHNVHIGEFLGAIAYEVRDRPKVVQFWGMRADGGPAGRLMRDIRAVQWLPLDAAIAKLTYPREQAFLRSVGSDAITAAERARQSGPDELVGYATRPAGLIGKVRAWWRRTIAA